MDIADIIRVVQFLLPSSLSVWIQRYGRVGRAGQFSIVILLVERSFFQRRKLKDKDSNTQNNRVEEADENIDMLQNDSDSEELVMGAADETGMHENLSGTYVKKAEDGMRDWTETQNCRCKIADKYFNNPPHSST